MMRPRWTGPASGNGFWRVTLPLLGHTLTLVSVLIVMHGLQVFTQVVVMPSQAGGPGNATYVLNLLVYNEAFTNLRFGFATATAFTLFIFVFVIHRCAVADSAAKLELLKRSGWRSREAISLR